MRLAIIIVNFRTPELTADCLRSLADQIESQPTQVVVVDNHSGDDSVRYLGETIEDNSWQSWVTLLPQSLNRGYAAGNNAALRPLLESEHPPDVVWLLNPDCIVEPDSLSALLGFLRTHPEAALAGSRLLDRDGEPQRSAFRFHTLLSELDDALRWRVVSRLAQSHVVAPPAPDRACRTDWVAGASLIVRREVFERIGLLDEGYFLYFEDVDFCLRARRAGFECWYAPESRVIHLVGSSTGVTDPSKATARRPSYWFQARHRYFRRNFGALYTVAADLVFLAGFVVWRLRRAIQGKPDGDPARFLGDFLRHSIFHLGSRHSLHS